MFQRQLGQRCDSNGRCLRYLALSIAIVTISPLSLAFTDPLDAPAEKVDRLTERPLLGLVRAGTRLIAVGSRGLIVYSDDGGKQWVQATVPVQSDLVAVRFPAADEGWAVGHDGVVLHSVDAGASWTKQFDGRMAAEAFKRYYETQVDLSDDVRAEGLRMVGLNFADGPALPFLDVCFLDRKVGYAVGSFGNLIATEDGGRTWQPRFHRIDNPDALNLNGIRMIDGQVYIAAERGVVFRLDHELGRFVPLHTGYAGSLFGIAGSADRLISFGLRGVIYISHDHGQSWTQLQVPSKATLNSAIADPRDRSTVLVNSAGQVLEVPANADRISIRAQWRGARAAALEFNDAGEVLVAGPAGVKKVADVTAQHTTAENIQTTNR